MREPASSSSGLRAKGVRADQLHADDLSFSYGGRDVLTHVTATVVPGQVLGVLGPNGSGKTTLLRCLMGFLEPRAGHVTMAKRSLSDWSRRDFARRVAVVPQEMPTDFPLTVRQLVSLGRLPHLPAHGLSFETASDLDAVEAALVALSIEDLGERPLHQLSGGELRRAFIARALAQATPFILLDEPTSGMDLRHQLAILDLLRARARAGDGVLVVLHDINLAAAHCDQVIVLKDGAVAIAGAPNIVLTPEKLGDVYGVDLTVVSAAGHGPTIMIPSLRRP